MRKGYHHIPFTPQLWAKWLNRFNTPPDQRLVHGIEEFRWLLTRKRKRL